MNKLAYSAGVLLCVASAAQAEIYRCEKDGKTTFTDRPCGAGAEPLKPQAPVLMEHSTGDAELARDYDRRASREARDRKRASADAVDAYAERKAKDDRIRAARIRGEVTKGMTPAQVRAVLGEPGQVATSQSSSGNSETWTYRKGDVTRTVQFKDGEVSSSSSRTRKSSR